MKTNSLIMLFLAMCFTVSLNAQKGKYKSPKSLKNDMTEVYSLTLKSDFEKIFSEYDMSKYFDYSGSKVKAQKGYKIMYSKNYERFILTTSKYDLDENEIDKITARDGTIELTNASICCAGCYASGIMSCNPAVLGSGGGTATVGCSNPCEYCTIYVDIKQIEAAEFITPDGGFGF